MWPSKKTMQPAYFYEHTPRQLQKAACLPRESAEGHIRVGCVTLSYRNYADRAMPVQKTMGVLYRTTTV